MVKEVDEEYEILDNGNIYFPVKDKDKKFSIISTITDELDEKTSKQINGFGDIFKEDYINSVLIREIWEDIKKKKYDKDCDWIVLIRANSFKNKISYTIDCLGEKVEVKE